MFVRTELTTENAGDCLERLSVCAPEDIISVELLGWGISNTLVKVVTDTSAFVIKQSLPQLNVEDEWLADVDRIHNEKICIDLLAPVITSGSVPSVLGYDPDNYLFVMTCAPESGVNWKEKLLTGNVSPALAGKAGQILGEIHMFSFSNENVRTLFANDKSFVQLRVEPYYYFTASKHQDVANIIFDHAQGLLSNKLVLVHGDYSPKNFIVHQSDLILLDFEVAHYGNPVFDLAFMLNHLFLKSIHNGSNQDLYFEAASKYLQDYRQVVSANPLLRSYSDENCKELLVQLGCLMLARIDGKSPVEYIVDIDVQDRVRFIAKEIISGKCSDIVSVMNLISQ